MMYIVESNIIVSNVFAFQPNENSASIHVALLLWVALKDRDLTIAPFFYIDVPLKKEGTMQCILYQVDF